MAYLCHAGRRGRRWTGALRHEGGRLAIAVGGGAALALLVTACASLPPTLSSGADGRRFEIEHDVFAFANLVRAQRPGWNDDFANYCLIMARAAGQFYRFARFAPDRPAATPAEYERLVRQILDRPPWAPPPASEADRVVIPGYADLRAFSAAHEPLLKAAFPSNVLSMFHVRTWRVGVDFSPEHQEELARELVREVEAGRPAPVMVTNFPHEDLLNHSVLVYAHRPAQQGRDFLAYDPNDPGSPFTLYYDSAARAFWVGLLTYSPAGRVRAFRLYTSPLF
jgi:hypothetical protein